MVRYLKSNEYCKMFRISKATLYRQIKAGNIKYQKIGSQYLFPIEEPDKKDKAPIIIKRSKPIKKSELKTFFDEISPEIMRTFNSHPDFGSIKIEVHFHQGKAVKIECGKYIKLKIDENPM